MQNWILDYLMNEKNKESQPSFAGGLPWRSRQNRFGLVSNYDSAACGPGASSHAAATPSHPALARVSATHR